MIPHLKHLIFMIQKHFLTINGNILDSKSYYLRKELGPIFIVGPPRSGSTLLFQLIIKYCHVAYISNLMALFPSKMDIIFRLTKHYKYNVVKDSYYGFVPGIFSPNEAGKLMDLWFFAPKNSQQRKNIRAIVYRLSTQANAPILIKNVNNSLRIKNILKIFPNARFVHIKRNHENNVASLLAARNSLNKNAKKWWSVAPDGYENVLNQPAIKQVDWQIKKVNSIIKKSLANANGQYRYISIHYEDLCKNTAIELTRLFNALKVGYSLKKFDSNDIKTKK